MKRFNVKLMELKSSQGGAVIGVLLLAAVISAALPGKVVAVSEPADNARPVNEAGVSLQKVIVTGSKIEPNSTERLDDIAHFRLSLQRNPNNINSLMQLAHLISESDAKEARHLYKKVLEITPNNVKAKIDLLNTFNVDRKEVLSTMLVRDPKNDYILSKLGEEYASGDGWVKAQENYFMAYNIQPSNPGHAYNLAVSLDRLSQHRAAIVYYSRYLSLSDYSSVTRSVMKRIEEIE